MCAPGGRVIIVTWCHRDLGESLTCGGEPRCLTDPLPMRPQRTRYASRLAQEHWRACRVACVLVCERAAPGESLRPEEQSLLERINEAYYLPDWCSAADYTRLLSEWRCLRVWCLGGRGRGPATTCLTGASLPTTRACSVSRDSGGPGPALASMCLKDDCGSCHDSSQHSVASSAAKARRSPRGRKALVALRQHGMTGVHASCPACRLTSSQVRRACGTCARRTGARRCRRSGAP